jgi:hypothetical protein
VEGAQLSTEEGTEQTVESIKNATQGADRGAASAQKSVEAPGAPQAPREVSPNTQPNVAEKFHRGMKDVQSALNQMPEDGGHMQGAAPEMSHGE